MTPAARIQAAIDVLQGLSQSALPADRFLRDFFAARRYAGSKDRAAISGRVYAVLRNRASLAHRMQSEAPRALVIASLLSEGGREDDIAASFGSSSYAPPALSEEERARIRAVPPPPPFHVANEFPAFLEDELRRAFGETLPEELQAMRARAPVDLRVNRLKATRDAVLEGLRSLDFNAQPTPYSSDGIRLASAEGLNRLQQTEFFKTGAIEFQDESSQLAALLCGAAPGNRVLDIAAGGGGKSLALAAIMDNRGEIFAWDENHARLKQLGPRALRAGIINIKMQKPEAGDVFDIVLVDAPCSGSGAWRRNPENKWRLTPERLERLRGIQDGLLIQAASYVKPGGRLVYATCSLLPSENEDRVESFLTRAPFALRDAGEIWRGMFKTPPPFAGRYFRASPYVTESDGFFAAILAKPASP